MNKIPLAQYAKQHGIDGSVARRRASSGDYKTAEKMGRDWFIDADEPHIDKRIKSGKYIGWRK